MQRVLEAGGFDALEATEAGLREGIFFAQAARRPARAAVRRRARARACCNLAAQFDAAAAHTRHVAALALSMFDELAARGLHPGDPVERELLWAAAHLHDVGIAVDYDDHHKHSRYLILNAGLPGLHPARGRADRPGRALPPQGHARSPARSRRCCADGDAELLDRCAALLRLAEDLERSRDQAVREAHVTADGKADHPARPRRRRRGAGPALGRRRARTSCSPAPSSASSQVA